MRGKDLSDGGLSGGTCSPTCRALKNHCGCFRQLLGRNRTFITVFVDEGVHTSRHSQRRRAQEIEMEFAALVIFSSVALWFAEELNGNEL